MQRRPVSLLASVTAVAMLLAGCAAGAVDGASVDPAHVEPIEGSELSTITLTARAAERLGIRTTAAEAGATADGSVAVPYSALLYDADGTTWVYVNPEPLRFVRHPVTVDRIDGSGVLLSAGPDPGTAVVSVGAVELFGAELGVGH